MPATTCGSKKVLDTGSILATGNVRIEIPHAQNVLFEFTASGAGVSGIKVVPQADFIHVILTANLSTGWQGDIAGEVALGDLNGKPVGLHFNAGASRPGVATLTWTALQG